MFASRPELRPCSSVTFLQTDALHPSRRASLTRLAANKTLSFPLRASRVKRALAARRGGGSDRFGGGRERDGRGQPAWLKDIWVT